MLSCCQCYSDQDPSKTQVLAQLPVQPWPLGLRPRVWVSVNSLRKCQGSSSSRLPGPWQAQDRYSGWQQQAGSVSASEEQQEAQPLSHCPALPGSSPGLDAQVLAQEAQHRLSPPNICGQLSHCSNLISQSQALRGFDWQHWLTLTGGTEGFKLAQQMLGSNPDYFYGGNTLPFVAGGRQEETAKKAWQWWLIGEKVVRNIY